MVGWLVWMEMNQKTRGVMESREEIVLTAFAAVRGGNPLCRMLSGVPPHRRKEFETCRLGS
jgi:hypothetical protein